MIKLGSLAAKKKKNKRRSSGWGWGRWGWGGTVRPLKGSARFEREEERKRERQREQKRVDAGSLHKSVFCQRGRVVHTSAGEARHLSLLSLQEDAGEGSI